MTIKRLLHLFIAIALLIVSACGKKKESPAEQKEEISAFKGLIRKQTVLTNQPMEWNFSYTNFGKVLMEKIDIKKAGMQTKRYTFEYPNGSSNNGYSLYETQFNSGEQAFTGVTQFVNEGNLLTTSSYRDILINTDVANIKSTFTYTFNGIILRALIEHIDINGRTIYADDCSFGNSDRNNIFIMHKKRYVNGSLEEKLTYVYEYDQNPNPFKGITPIIDFAAYFSTNNYVSRSILEYDNSKITRNYIYNDEGMPISYTETNAKGVSVRSEIEYYK